MTKNPKGWLTKENKQKSRYTILHEASKVTYKIIRSLSLRIN